MARRCILTGKAVLAGNNVSHSNRKTRRRFLPNMQDVSLDSDILGRAVKLRIPASTIRTIEKRGGIDNYLAGISNKNLTEEALAIKRTIQKHSSK